MISLKEATFDFESINPQIVGAGILPVSVDDDGTVRFLLGKERYINHWRGSLKWSGFEGGRKSGEKVERTAAREFVEESMGIVELDGISTIDAVTNYLLDEKYVSRIVLCIIHEHQPERRYHVTYLVQIPHIPEYNTEFINRRRTFVDLQQKASQILKYQCQVSEWNLPCEANMFQGELVQDILHAESDNHGNLKVKYKTDRGECHVVNMHCLDADEVDTYLKWTGLRTDFVHDVRQLTSPCNDALTMTVNSGNIMTCVKFNEDYVEKQAIQWWSMDDLKIVIQNGGYINADFFRAYFLPVLQRSIKEIDDITSSMV